MDVATKSQLEKNLNTLTTKYGFSYTIHDRFLLLRFDAARPATPWETLYVANMAGGLCAYPARYGDKETRSTINLGYYFEVIGFHKTTWFEEHAENYLRRIRDGIDRMDQDRPKSLHAQAQITGISPRFVDWISHDAVILKLPLANSRFGNDTTFVGKTLPTVTTELHGLASALEITLGNPNEYILGTQGTLDENKRPSDKTLSLKLSREMVEKCAGRGNYTLIPEFIRQVQTKCSAHYPKPPAVE